MTYRYVIRVEDTETSCLQCSFPFVYQGILFSGCTSYDHDQLWCSTSTNDLYHHMEGQWINCNADNCCPNYCVEADNFQCVIGLSDCCNEKNINVGMKESYNFASYTDMESIFNFSVGQARGLAVQTMTAMMVCCAEIRLTVKALLVTGLLSQIDAALILFKS